MTPGDALILALLLIALSGIAILFARLRAVLDLAEEMQSGEIESRALDDLRQSHRRRVSELFVVNNREVARRRAAEALLKSQSEAIGILNGDAA